MYSTPLKEVVTTKYYRSLLFFFSVRSTGLINLYGSFSHWQVISASIILTTFSLSSIMKTYIHLQRLLANKYNFMQQNNPPTWLSLT